MGAIMVGLLYFFETSEIICGWLGLDSVGKAYASAIPAGE
jgi:hypothetical protein